VVKILPEYLAGQGEESIHHFQREARAVSMLNHPNIVSIFDAGFDNGWHYIAMEFVDGETLRQMMAAESRPLDDKAILDLICQVAAALSAAHEAGIVHRDIKPENIMVRPDGLVKVLDFGLAKLREAKDSAANRSDLRTRPGSLAGTVQYLSPEQILGDPAGPRSDLFGVGVVAYELATGVRPFDGPTDGAIFNAILNRTPPPPSSVRSSRGSELDRVIMRVLEKDPELRFQTARDLRSSCRVITRDHIAEPLTSERALRQQDGAERRADSIPVRGTDDSSGNKASATDPARAFAARAAGSKRSRVAVALACLVAACATLIFWLGRPLPPPNVTRIEQITNDGRRVDYFVTDGTRLYYAAGNNDPGIKMFQVGAKGGAPLPMPRLNGMFPLDISPDHTEMLLGQFVKGNAKGAYPIWIADTLGNAPRRAGDLTVEDASWSPKGDEILYANGAELRVARSDGSESRKVATVKGIVLSPAWSPDGRMIRFTLLAKNSTALWEVASDGSDLHAVFPDWVDRPQEEGIWTPNGRYFVFTAEQGLQDLWAVRQERRLFESGHPNPLRLTAGPMRATRPRPSPDGHRIFFVGDLNLGELVRYDLKLDAWIPFLGGLAAMQLDYSRDGKWLTYIGYPDGSVWRCAADGSDRLQLTAPPLFATNPRWSPDGSQITFFGSVPGKPSRIYVVPAGGGAVRQITHGESGPSGDVDSTWSPDGASLVFSAQSADQRNSLALHIIDLKTEHFSQLPDSDGLWSPRWSPDGHYLGAIDPKFRLSLYDLGTKTTTTLTNFGVGFPSWSRDGRYLYFEDNATANWYRVAINDRRVKRLVSLKDLKMAPSTLGWVGLTPDGSLISTKDAGRTDIYGLDWDAP
jgi:Tol biopolymer transport system component